MKKQKLLIIYKGQLGGLIDELKWCEYLKTDYTIIHIGIDSKRPRISIDGVKEILSPSFGPRFLRGLLYTILCIWKIFFFKGKIMVIYYPSCSIFKRVFPYKKMLLDIRTLSVSNDKKYNERYNKQLIETAKLYDSVSVISEGVAKKIGLKNIHILPLGADRISSSIKNYVNGLRILYVGTLTDRHIEKTIKGVGMFHKKHPSIPIKYIIIGDGKNQELQVLKNTACDCTLQQVVEFKGRLPYNELAPYFDSSNIGMSFIPITEWYQDQPPTKTYEYIMSGLFCIATNTNSNASIITKENGLLIMDSETAVSEALYTFWNKRKNIKQQDIECSIINCNWNYIVNTCLKRILDSI
jgi:glycosyltransferase involved in cell wall biosynthesis